MSENGGYPNARGYSRDGTTMGIARVGDTLKVRYKAVKEEGSSWLTFDPANLHIELNGEPVWVCDKLELVIDNMADSMPRCRLSITLEEIDIDADTLNALQAFVKSPDAAS